MKIVALAAAKGGIGTATLAAALTIADIIEWPDA